MPFDPFSFSDCVVSNLGLIKKGQYVYEQGSTACEFYLVNQGLIGLYHDLENGKSTLMRIYADNEFFGYRTLIGGSRYHCSAKVLRDAYLIRIRPNNVDLFLQNNAQFFKFLTKNLCNELQDAENRLASIAFSKSIDRVAKYTKYLKERYPNYKWTYREIAQYAGCETETLIRLSKTLQEEQIEDPK